VLIASPASAQDSKGADKGDPAARLTLEVPNAGSTQDFATSVKIALALTALSLVPAILVTATSFTRIVIVLGFVRTGMATPNMPPNQVIVGLSIALTLLAMGPTIEQVYDTAATPYLKQEIDTQTALKRAEPVFRAFLLRHTRQRDLALYVELSRVPRPETPADLPLRVLLPAFITSELTTAFEMGVVILIPFLVIDFVVSSVLLAMNMMMLPPATVSTPMKVLLFVLVDGWHLVVKSLVTSAA
jgi:flagellar biosynthetic protein FliP